MWRWSCHQSCALRALAKVSEKYTGVARPRYGNGDWMECCSLLNVGIRMPPCSGVAASRALTICCSAVRSAQHYCLWTVGTCAEPSLVLLCMMRVDSTTPHSCEEDRAQGDLSASRKTEGGCSNRNLLEGHRPFLRRSEVTLKMQ